MCAHRGMGHGHRIAVRAGDRDTSVVRQSCLIKRRSHRVAMWSTHVPATTMTSGGAFFGGYSCKLAFNISFLLIQLHQVVLFAIVSRFC